MKPYYLTILILLFFATSCEEMEESSTCQDNPTENVEWIKDLIKDQDLSDCDTCSLEIIQYDYNGDTVFSVDNCLDCSDALIKVYDCEENVVCEFGGIAGLNTCPDFETEATEVGVIFSSRMAEESITKITFQNSFGFCVGYCTSTIEIENQKLTFVSKDSNGELEPIGCEFDLNDEQWQNIQYNLNIDQFLLMEEVYGCPDCSDGGASFIEMELITGETKKVTFEYNYPPTEIEDYANMLQTLLDGANKCEDAINNEKCDKKVIISNEVYESLSASPIESLRIEGNCMQVTFTLLSTQDPIEDVVLVDSGLVAESFPVQRSLKFYVKENLTLPTFVQATTSFDISELATWDAPEVLLNIEGYEQIKFTRQPQCGDPNINCLPTTIEQDFKELTFMLNELQVISSIVSCETSEDILLAPVGSKACGGPQLFLPYTNSINVEEFLSKVEKYTQLEDAYNTKWGVFSTCEIINPPTIICENGKLVLVVN